MSKSSGNRDALEMRPDDVSGRYWSSPPCKVRVDDGSRVTWIDLKRPYALIGSHDCCTLRIRGVHVPDVAYFACCLRDRVEIWPVAAIAFPRWGAIRSDLPVVVGPCSMTFHLAGDEPPSSASIPFLADSEIETRVSSPGQDFPKLFRRPVTIIGDDHPSVLRLHGRGMGCCHYAAVVQDQSLWLVDLSAKRMQRSERVRRFHQPGDKLLMGDATLELVAAKSLVVQDDSGEDSGIGLGTEVSEGDLHADSDIHSDADIHSGDGASGMSAMASGIHSYDPDPSVSFISANPKSDSSPPQEPPKPLASPDGSPYQDAESSNQGGSDHGDEEDPKLCLTEGKVRKSRSIGDADFDELVDSRQSDSEDESPAELDSLIRRVDGAQHGVKRPTNPSGPIKSSTKHDESSTEAALSLVDTALGLVDAAVQESDSADETPPSTRGVSASASSSDSHPPTLDLGDEDPNIHSLEPDQAGLDVNPYESSDVSLTGHDPPTLVDRCDASQLDAAATHPESAPDSESVSESAGRGAGSDVKVQQGTEVDHLNVDDFNVMGEPDCVSEPSLDSISSEVEKHEGFPAQQKTAADVDAEDPPTGGSQDCPRGGISPSSVVDQIIEENWSFTAAPAGLTTPTPENHDEPERLEEPESLEELEQEDAEPFALGEPEDLVIDTIERADRKEIDEMTNFERSADPSLVDGPVSSPDVDVPRQPEAEPLAHSGEPHAIPKAAHGNNTSPMTSRAAVPPRSQRGGVDPEALTSHITSRLSEIGQSRSLLQQIIRWFAITAGIIVPTTVVAWVVHRIYSDWF